MTRILAYLFILFPFKIIAQPADFASIEKTGQNNYQLSYSQFYDGNSLWGYMDGGADLYLEYGFEGLLVQEINYKNTTIKCEIFRMKDAVGAFGIFSVNRHRCRTTPDLSEFHCINNYQVQMVKGNYYLSFINQSGDSVSQSLAIEITGWFSNIIDKGELQLPALAYFSGKPDKLMFIRGNISLSNVYPQSLLNLEKNSFSMWLFPAETKKSPVVSLVTFENETDLQKYLSIAFPQNSSTYTWQTKLKNGNKLEARKTDNFTLLQIEGKANKKLKNILGFDGIK